MMNATERKALLAHLVERLREQGSWCGETHVQKACYLLQEAAAVPTGFSFVLYKYGPFAFDLRDELTHMKAEGLLGFEVQPAPYGPKLTATPRGQRLIERLGQRLDRFSEAVDWVAEELGSKGAGSLEALATAVMMAKRHPGASEDELVEHLRSAKPHLSTDEARDAVRTANEFLTDAQEQRPDRSAR